MIRAANVFTVSSEESVRCFFYDRSSKKAGRRSVVHEEKDSGKHLRVQKNVKCSLDRRCSLFFIEKVIEYRRC